MAVIDTTTTVDWNSWSSVHQVQLRAFRCADALTEMDDDNIKVGSSRFDVSDVNSQRLQVVHWA